MRAERGRWSGGHLGRWQCNGGKGPAFRAAGTRAEGWRGGGAGGCEVMRVLLVTDDTTVKRYGVSRLLAW